MLDHVDVTPDRQSASVTGKHDASDVSKLVNHHSRDYTYFSSVASRVNPQPSTEVVPITTQMMSASLPWKLSTMAAGRMPWSASY